MLFSSQEPWMVVMNISLLLLIFILLRSILGLALKEPDNLLVRCCHFGAICLALLFCIFSFWGEDWFHYQEDYEYIKATESSATYEEFYVYLICAVCPHYLIFRLIIWGGAIYLLLIYRFFLGIHRTVFLLIFFTTWFLFFSYGRVSLAMSSLYAGSVLLVQCSQKFSLNKILFSILLIGLSFFFHKTAIYGIALILLCLPFYNNRIGLILPIIVVPILLFAIQILLNSLDLSPTSSSEDRVGMMSNIANSYFSQDDDSSSTKGWLLAVILEYLSYYIVAIFSFLLIWSKRLEDNKMVKYTAYLLIWIVITSSIFALDFGVNTSIFYGRFLRFSIIPAAVVLSYAYENKLLLSFTRFSYLIAFVSTFYRLSYILLSSITHS